MHHRNRFEPVVRTYLYEIRYVLLGMHLNFFLVHVIWNAIRLTGNLESEVSALVL